MKRLLVVTALLLAAACGGGDDAAPGSATRPTGLPSAAASIVAGLASADCKRVSAQLAAAGAALASSKSSSPSQTLTGVASSLEDAADKLDKADVRAAVQTLATAFRQLAKDLKGVSSTSSSGGAASQTYTDALKALSTPKVTAASKVLSGYLAGGCK